MKNTLTIDLRDISPSTAKKLRRALSSELTINSKSRKLADSVGLRRQQTDLVEMLVQCDGRIKEEIYHTGF